MGPVVEKMERESEAGEVSSQHTAHKTSTDTVVNKSPARSLWDASIDLAKFDLTSLWRPKSATSEQKVLTKTLEEANDLNNKYSTKNTITRLFSLASENCSREMIQRAVCVTAMAGIPYYVANVTAKICLLLSQTATNATEALGHLHQNLGLMVVGGAVLLGATLMNSRLNSRFRIFMENKLTHRMGQALFLKQEDVESEKTKKLLNSVNWNREAVTNFIDNFYLVGKDVASFTIGAAILLHYSPAAAGVMGLVGCLFALNKVKSARDRVRTLDMTSDTRQKFGARQWYQGFPPAIRQIKLLSNEQEFAEKTMEALGKVTEEDLKLVNRDSKRDSYVGTAEFVAYSAIFATFAYQTLQTATGAVGGIGYQTFLELTAGLMIIRNSLQNLREAVGSQFRNSVYARRFLLVVDLAEEAKQERAVREMPELPFDTSKPPRLVFENVTYTHPDSESKETKEERKKEKAPAVNALSLTIEPGELVALCGKPGSGKTTIFDMLGKLKDPLDGRITVDGYDLRVLPEAKWREYLSMHVQNFMLFESLQLDELAKMGESSTGQNREFWEAADLVGANFLRQKEYTPENVWGQGYENGISASGGEQQQFGLLRTSMKEPHILIVDEPTSNLGPQETEVVVKMIEQARRAGVTVILATHDYSIFNALQPDKIAVLKEGKMEILGTHEELMKSENTYSTNLKLARERIRERE